MTTILKLSVNFHRMKGVQAHTLNLVASSGIDNSPRHLYQRTSTEALLANVPLYGTRLAD